MATPTKTERRRKYLVVAVYYDDDTRFADSYWATDPQGAEQLALAEHPGLVIAGVLDARGTVVA